MRAYEGDRVPSVLELLGKNRMREIGFKGRVKEPKFTCLSPGAERGNVCNYPWWTIFIRLGTLWECPRCHKVSILEWAQAGDWGCKMWQTYREDA